MGKRTLYNIPIGAKSFHSDMIMLTNFINHQFTIEWFMLTNISNNYKAYVAPISFVQTNIQEFPFEIGKFQISKSMYTTVRFNLCAKRLPGQ